MRKWCLLSILASIGMIVLTVQQAQVREWNIFAITAIACFSLLILALIQRMFYKQ
jgi:hypothetical protein